MDLSSGTLRVKNKKSGLNARILIFKAVQNCYLTTGVRLDGNVAVTDCKVASDWVTAGFE
jgi:hypothetical protein